MCNSNFVQSLESRVLFSHYMVSGHAYSDGKFNDSDWEVITVGLGNGGTSSSAQVAKGGKPGKFRQVTTTVNSDPGGSEVFSFNGKLSAVYDPATSGAITSIKYSEFNRLLVGFGQGQETGPALKQNGQEYFMILPYRIIPQYTWKKIAKLPKLTAADFIASDNISHPDFSQTAAPIEFGFYRANSAGGGGGYTVVAGIDKWSLTVRSKKVVGT